MRVRSLSVLFAFVTMTSASMAQQFDVDLSPTDTMSRGNTSSSQAKITRSAPSVGSGPQLDLSGGLGDTLGQSGSCSTCAYGSSTSTSVDTMRQSDLLK